MKYSLSRFSLIFCLFISQAQAACPQLIKLHGTIDLESKKWMDTEIDAQKTQVCVSVDDTHPNLELVFRSGKQVFKSKILSSLEGFYDVQDKDKKMTGGKYPIRFAFIETWAPVWAKGSSLTITDLREKKIILETKL